MARRVITIILLAVIGILGGASFISQQLKDPFLRELMRQQTEILRLQQKMSQELAARQAVPQPADLMAQIPQKQQALEQRIAALESQVRSLQAALQQGQGGAAPSQVPPRPPSPDFTTVHEIPVAHTPVIGKKGVPVTIVEFVDFQCPFCARFHSPMAEAVKAFAGKVNYMVKNYPLPFHPQAKPAAKAAFAAGEQGKYSEMVDVILANGQNLNEELFGKLAKDLGLNVEKFWKDYREKDAQWEKYIQEDITLGAKVGVQGTPTFYINGRLTNSRETESWKKEIEGILSASGGKEKGR